MKTINTYERLQRLTLARRNSIRLQESPDDSVFIIQAIPGVKSRKLQRLEKVQPRLVGETYPMSKQHKTHYELYITYSKSNDLVFFKDKYITIDTHWFSHITPLQQ